MTTLSTPELIRRYQTGQESLFDVLFERYKDYVYRVAYGYVQNAADAQDITQETFLDVLKALPHYDPEGPARFETWLYRVTANRCKMHIRHRRPTVVEWDQAGDLDSPGVNDEKLSEDLPGPEETAQQADARRVLWQAVGRLQTIYREIILLRYGYDMAYDEIACALNVNIGTVKSRLNTAHRLLQDLLSEGNVSGGQLGNRRRSSPFNLLWLWLLGKLCAPTITW